MKALIALLAGLFFTVFSSFAAVTWNGNETQLPAKATPANAYRCFLGNFANPVGVQVFVPTASKTPLFDAAYLCAGKIETQQLAVEQTPGHCGANFGSVTPPSMSAATNQTPVFVNVQVNNYADQSACTGTNTPKTNTFQVYGQSIGPMVQYSCPPADEYKSHPRYGGYTKLVDNQCLYVNPSCPKKAGDGIDHQSVVYSMSGKPSVCVKISNGAVCPYMRGDKAGEYVPQYGGGNQCADKEEDIKPPAFDCVEGGNGLLLCKGDPVSKCYKNPDTSTNVCIEDKCGMIDGFYWCVHKGEKPKSFNNCTISGKNFACLPDIPPPKDNITDPSKALTDMKKQDFKDAALGVESRLDGLSSLVAQSSKQDQLNTNKLDNTLNSINSELGNKLDKIGANTEGLGQGLSKLGKLDDIDQKLGDIGNKLEYDGDLDELVDSPEGMRAKLGLTGDETYTDLDDDPISLEDFTSKFSAFFGSGSCPAPRSVSMLGKSYSVDWVPFCTFFSMLGYLVMAAAYVIAAKIVFGGSN